MKGKRFLYAVVVFALIFAVAGCGTVPKKYKEEVSSIKSKVDTLETRVGEIESKQAAASEQHVMPEQSPSVEEMKAPQMEKSNISVKPRGEKSRARMKEIQACLKNAGFYDGAADGLKGRKTRKAIKAFQKANGLRADGVVGKKTWEALEKYAQGPVAGAAKQQEGATK